MSEISLSLAVGPCAGGQSALLDLVTRLRPVEPYSCSPCLCCLGTCTSAPSSPRVPKPVPVRCCAWWGYPYIVRVLSLPRVRILSFWTLFRQGSCHLRDFCLRSSAAGLHQVLSLSWSCPYLYHWCRGFQCSLCISFQ